MKVFTSLFIVSFLVFTSCTSAENVSETNNEPPTGQADFESNILTLLNNYRTSKGLPKLEILDIIKSQTDKHTDYMINANAISHDNFNDRFTYLAQNAQAKGAAENVAVGYNSPKSVVDGWIKSNGHRKNIEGNFTHFHITAKQNNRGIWYYTNIFIRK